METTMERVSSQVSSHVSSRDARAAIFARHEELRGLVNETIRIADAAGAAEPGFEPLRAYARELYEAFEVHLDFEEGILIAALRDVIGWGSVLRAQVVEAHQKQRATLASALSALNTGDVGRNRVVADLHTVADILLADMTTEDQCLMTADLDAMSVDARGG
jgi:hemerythrin HHE cation binding domain-containing protein